MSEPPRPVTPDFLDRVINKTLGAGDAIQPRLPAFYEPAMGLGPSAVTALPIEITAPGDAAMNQSAQRVIRDVPAQQMHDVHAEPVSPNLGQDLAYTVPARERNQSVATGPEDRTPRLATLTPTAPTAAMPEANLRVVMLPTEEGVTIPRRTPALSLQLAQEAADAPPRIRAPLTVLQTAPLPAMVSILANEDNALDEIRSPHKRWHEPGPVNGEAVTRGALIPAATAVAQNTAVQSRSEAGWQLSSSQQSQTSDADPVPVVNVTIGRVEVRAVQAPSAPAREHTELRRAKPMSLDDYLKQRGGGR